MKHITKESCNWIDFISVAQFWRAATINHLHVHYPCPRYNLYSSVTQIYNSEVRDDGSGQPWDDNRVSLSSAVVRKLLRNGDRAMNLWWCSWTTSCKCKILSGNRIRNNGQWKGWAPNIWPTCLVNMNMELFQQPHSFDDTGQWSLAYLKWSRICSYLQNSGWRSLRASYSTHDLELGMKIAAEAIKCSLSVRWFSLIVGY